MGLLVTGRVDSKIHVPGPGLTDWHTVDLLGFRAIDEENLNLTVIGARDVSTSVGLHAPRAEDDSAVPEAPRLALGAQEPSLQIEHEIVALVDPERQQDSVTPAHQFGEDRRLGSLSDIDWVFAESRCLLS
jgi:hypothetical protein